MSDRDEIVYSYDEENIREIREEWAKEESSGTIRIKQKMYTMVQSNAGCEVNVTDESMRLCVEALLK